MVLRRKFPTKLCSSIPRQEAIHTECLRRSAEMHSLMAELGQMQRQQQEQLQRFSVNSAEETKEAKQRFVELRDQLNRHSQRVEQSIAEADRLCVEGADSLAPEQFHLLKESRQRLHSTFESLSRQTDSVLARLDLATALLLEFTARASAFQSWVYERGRQLDALRADSGHPNGLEESRRRFRTLNEEILAKRPELSGISQLAQRIEAEIGAYLDEMSGRPAGREGTPTRGTQLQKHHQVRDTVQRAQDDYEALLNSKQDFDQMLRRLANFSMQYEQRLGEAHGWLDDLERAISHAALGATGDIETRLANLLRLNQNAIEGQPKIDAVQAAAHQLDEATVQTDAHETLLTEHEGQIVELRRKYSTLSDRLKDGVDSARTEMTQREGLAQGLRQMDDWLGKMQRKMDEPRRIPLSPTKLSELKYEDQLERGELESKERTLAELGAILRTQKTVKDLDGSGSEFDAQFEKAIDRFRRIGSTARAHSDNLGDAISAYEEWQRQETTLADHLLSLHEAIAHLDTSDMENAEKLGQELTELEANDWAHLQELAKKLSQIPNVEGIDQIMEKMRTHESLLARLRDALGSKLNSGHRLSQSRKQFWQKAQQIDSELGQIEQRIQANANTISGSPDQREAQRNECTELENKLGNIRNELEALEQMGSDLIRNGGAKRLSGKDGADPVTKITGLLFELHRREEYAQRALNDLQGQIAEFDSATQTWLMEAEAMSRWLDVQNAKIAKAWAILTWEPKTMAEQRAETQQGAQKQRQQQTKMTQLQLKYKELARKEGSDEIISTIGVNEMDNRMRELEMKWNRVEAEWANMDKCIGTAECLHRDAKRMDHWLGAKIHLLDGCTISAADVKLVDAQLGIVNILETEMTDERPRWSRLNDDAIEAVRLAQSETFSGRIVARMDELNRKWRELEKALEMKVTALNEARKQISNFEQLQRELRHDLRTLESSLNEAATMQPGQSQQLSRLLEAQNELENQLRPSLEKMRVLAENIQRIWSTDAALRSDLDDRVDGMERQIEELILKLESVKKAAKSASAAEEELNQELAELSNWVKSQKRELDALPSVSAEPNKLAEQIEQLHRPYVDILAKEGCVIVAGSKAASLLSQTPSAELKRRLIHLNEIWPPLIYAAKERHEKLGRTKKALDELIGTEKEIKETLATLNDELATVKLAEKNNATGTLPAALESIHQRLISLGPCVESAFILMNKLERAIDGGSAETKKHRIALEQLKRDYSTILAECSAGLEQAKTKEALRARFDSEADSLQSLLDTYQSTLGIDDHEMDGVRSLDMNGNAEIIGKDALKLGLAEFDSRWSKGSRQLQTTQKRLIPLLDGQEANSLTNRQEELEMGAKRLRQKLAKQLANFKEGEGKLENLLTKVRQICGDLSELGERIASLPGIGRDQLALGEQQKECKQFKNELMAFSEGISELDWRLAEMADNKHLPQNQLKSAGMDLGRAEKQKEKLEAQIEERVRQIEEMHNKLDGLDSQVGQFLAAISAFSSSEHLRKPIGTDLTTLNAQKDELSGLKTGKMAELGAEKTKIEAECKGLIRGAGPSIKTEKLEAHLVNMNSVWESFSADMERRERDLDAAVQALGSIREAQQSLLNWLEQTEELLTDQPPPSADHKVVKAQLQSQQFQLRVVSEKKQNVDGFLDLVEKLATQSEQQQPGQANQLRLAGEHISSRYTDLVEGVKGRHLQLEEALLLTQEWSQLNQGLAHFLDETEKSILAFDRIPTDARRMDEQIGLKATLQAQADAQRANFDRFVELSAELCQIVGLEDGQEVDAQMHRIVGRYDGLQQRLTQYNRLMDSLAEDIGIFLSSTAQMAEWLDRAEREVQTFGDLPIEPEELSKRSDALVEFVNDVSVKAQLLENVIEISRELCAHSSGSDALALQYRTDQLKQRYNQLADEADAKIVVWEKALPLAENYKEGTAELREHLDGVEEDLQNLGQVVLEEQFQLVNTIDSDLGPAREQLEAVQTIGIELQRLTTEQRANQLAKESAELLRRFNAVADAAARKADQLGQAERQSRLTFDVLDFWIDWFNEVQEQIVRAEKPAVDMEQLKVQLRQQRQLNEEIAAEKTGLREMIADASKVARELSTTLGGQEGQDALLAKVEKAKRMAEETAELGAERTAELEQAFALCKELDGEYTELNDWMDALERELRACEPITTGMAPKALLAQQQHNNGMLQQIQSQRPIVAKFERNVAALSELCAQGDEQNLRQISEQIAERFEEMANAFRERGDMLTTSLEQSSQLGDRLNMFLANLGSALNQLQAQEAPSCRPPVLRRQMAEMEAIFELLHQKQLSYMATKEQCQEMIGQARPEQQNLVSEMHQKMEELDHRWLELNSGAEFRQTQLATLLPIAEHFWAQLDMAQQTIGQCRQQCDQFGIATSGADVDAASTQIDQLHQRHAQLQKLQASIGECSLGVQQAIGEGMELCQRLGSSEEEQTFVQQHLAALQAQWDAFLAHHAQLSGSLNFAMDQSLQFHDLLEQLTAFLAQKESQCANILFGTIEENAQSPPPLMVESISENLQIVEAIRRELDDAILRREQLNQMGAELCAQPGALAAATSIRQPLMELNQRWNRLYSQLGDQQHRLERALLDMGQFSQAHGQMLSWMEKTQSTLAGIYPNPGGGLKHVEIEMCKLRVLQNDIQAHQPSYEAILATGRQMLRQQPETQQSTTQSMLEEMTKKWAKLCEQSDKLWANLERARLEAASRGNDLEKWQLWLADLLVELRSNRPVGGLPETAASQLDEFRIMRADVVQRRPEMEELLKRLGEDDAKDELTNAQFAKLKEDWGIVQEKLVEKEKRLRQALEDALELAKGMQEIQDWLQEAEQHLAMVPHISKLVSPLEEQLAIHQKFNEEVQTKSQLMKELNNKGVRMQLNCEKKDAIPMKNRLVSLKHRTDKLQQKSQERLQILTNALEESKQFFGSRNKLLDWIDEQQNWLQEKETEKMGTGERIRELLDEHKRRLMEQIQRRGAHYEDTRIRGDALGEFAPPGEKRQIEETNEELHQKWTDLGKRALRRQRSLEEALIQSGQFEEVLAELLEWLATKLPPLEAEVQSPNYFGDIDTVNALMREHFAVVEQAEARKGNVQNVEERAKRILANEKAGDPAELKELAEKTAQMNDEWARLEKAIVEQDQRFTAALKKAVDLSEMMHDLGFGLQEIEGQIRRLALPWDEPSVLAEQEKLEKLRDDFQNRQAELERVLELARELQSKAHLRAESPMRDLIRGIGTRWEVVEQLLREKGEKMRNRLEEIRQHERKMDELLIFVEEKQGQLDFMRDYKDEGQLVRLNTFMEEERMFRIDLQQRQPELEEALKMAGKRQSFGGGISVPLPSIKEREEVDGLELMQKSIASISDKSPYKRRDSQSQGQLSPTKRAGSKLKLNDKSTSQTNLDQTKSPSTAGMQRVKRKNEQLGDGWKKLWVDLLQYGEHLRERKAYLDEMERLKDFTFEEWRERYLAWNDHGKARVSDLFRRIDKTGTGMVPRKLFIDGILASKFPTTELEMSKVADEFDKGDGLISAREFMNALRYDPKKMRGRHEAAKTETERIHEEIARETARCTCAHRFPIHHISTEKDRVQYGFGFGGSMKRMVRILRSTVMVRVGGGWEALDGFLAKHDPCRAKGRINVDFLPLTPEGHLGPHGAHIDRIAQFHVRRKDSASSSMASGGSPAQQQHQAVERLLGYSPGQPGPIMKLREKTERSVPMFKRPLAPGSNGSAASIAGTSTAPGQHQRRGSDHSIIDDIYGSSRIPRAAGGSRLGSDLGSNPSRPASRGSDVGSDFGASTGSGTRIPSYRAQKGVRFAGIQSSGRNTPSAGSDQ